VGKKFGDKFKHLSEDERKAQMVDAFIKKAVTELWDEYDVNKNQELNV
jgi:hypothetical protein